MKHKLNKWHIALMSFLTLFIAVFASLFSLRADTVDEETGEVLTDNWELGVVFYDSTVDNGKTPLTEINWDATNNTLSEGEPRIITVQINYKNNSAITTYQPGELGISIPNLAYNADLYWNTSITVGANDSTHTGYEWSFQNKSQRQTKDPNYTFINANIIEEKSNFEGSIQIVYSLTPKKAEPEKFLNECFKDKQEILIAKLYYFQSNAEPTIISSPNFPGYYPANMTFEENFWECIYENTDALRLKFHERSHLNSSADTLRLYNKNAEIETSFTMESFPNKIFIVEGNYLKLAMQTGSSRYYYGFQAEIIPAIRITSSNEISFKYYRHLIHPWERYSYTITKTANKLSSIDGLPEGDYYWIKYSFEVTGSCYSSYPKIGIKNQQIRDSFPKECVVLDSSLNLMEEENNTYTINRTYWNGSSYKEVIYVGYPKSIYNDEAGNLNITNHVDLYSEYDDNNEFIKSAEDEISINLAEFEFNYDGNLYGIYKRFKTSTYDDSYIYYESLIGQDINLENGGYGYIRLTPSAIYTGKAMDIKYGDDLLFISDMNNSYRKLNDDEYYFTSISFNDLKNGNNVVIPNEKYDCELWVRYTGENSYILYEEFKNKNKTWSFTKENEVVGYYFIIKNMTESLFINPNYASEYNNAVLRINNAKNIPEKGSIYNFAFIQVYIDGVLQNKPEFNSYANFITKDLIATYDQETYGTYMQRSYGSISYDKFVFPDPSYSFMLKKQMSSPVQDVINEKFTGTITLSISGCNGYEFTPHMVENYGKNVSDEKNFLAGNFLTCCQKE